MTGESDLKNYYERIAQLQETYLRPALERLLPVMAISAFGYIPHNLEITFEPIATSTPAERAAILSQLTSSIVSLYQSSLLTRDQARRELQDQGNPLGLFSGLKVNEISSTQVGLDNIVL